MPLTDALRSEPLRSLPDEALVPMGFLRSLATQDRSNGDPGAMADLTVADVAEALGRAESTVRGWLLEGALAGYKLRGREWRVPRASLREFLDRQGDSKPTPVDGDDISAWRRYRKDGTA